MILNFLSAIWAAIASALGNHLWQSTLCLIIAGLLTLVLHKNSARTRYGIWLAASIKFLLPFSLLIAIGTHWARPRPAAPSQPGLFYAIEQASHPFAPAAEAERNRKPAQDAGLRYTLVHLLPAIFVAAWLCGFVAVLFVWYARWRRIAATVRDAAPLREGREVEALRSVERRAGIRKPMDLLVSPASLEPGVFGVVRPVLIWPEAISGRLDDAQLKTILQHEVGHLRRRDNLAAAIHMVVEAFFWFHPLVWWLTTRLVDERERACDEAVLAVGSERQVYAESILKTCEFCLESPLACVSGVTGADLKKRIVRIMTHAVPHRLSFGSKLLLTTVGLAALVAPICFGLASGAQVSAQTPQTDNEPVPPFEVVSIKLNRSGERGNDWYIRGDRFITPHATAKFFVADAYTIRDYLVVGGPSWVTSDVYTMEAKIEDSYYEKMRQLSYTDQERQVKEMLKPLLADRFHLKFHLEDRQMQTYELVIAKNGPKLQEAKPGDTYSKGAKWPNGQVVGHDGLYFTRGFGGGELTAQATDMTTFAGMLSHHLMLGQPVVDKTGLTGHYDFVLHYSMNEWEELLTSYPDLFTAIQQQLGLKLESKKGPVPVLVIDHIERPSEN
jgi:uncharacterized protein (TIGR03435 family)